MSNYFPFLCISYKKLAIFAVDLLGKNDMKHLASTILFFFICFIWSWAQLPMNFTNIDLPEKSIVYRIQEDELGLIWIGAEDGLYCYDGYRCYVRKGKDAASPKRIHAIIIENGILYLGTETGVYSYSIEADEFTCIIKEADEVRMILPYGDKLIIPCKQGLLAYDKETQQVKNVSPELSNVYAVAECGEGLLVGTLHGLYFAKDGKVFKRNYSKFISVIIPDVNPGYFWIGTDGNLIYYHSDTDRTQAIPELAGNNIKSFAVDDRNRLFVGTDNGLFVKDGNTYNHILHDSRNSFSISNNIICDIHIDRFSNLWISHFTGISKTELHPASHLWPLGDITGQSEGNVIYTISQDAEGCIWMGGTDGLIGYDQKGNSVWYKPTDKAHHITHNRIRAIRNDSDGDLWIVTDGGINLYDKNTGQMKNFIIENGEGNYSCRWAYDLLMDSNRNLWVAAYDGGVFVVNKDSLLASNGIYRTNRFIGMGEGLLSGLHARFLVDDNNGHIWVAGSEGVERVDAAIQGTEQIHSFYKGDIQFMTSDYENNIWIASDNKIICLNTEGKEIRNYEFNVNGLSPKAVSLVSVNKEVWAFGQNYCRIFQQDGQVQIFSLPGFDTFSAFYSELNQQILLGGEDKVLCMSNVFEKEKKSKKLLLTEVIVNGESYRRGMAPSVLKELTLKSFENNLELCFSDIPYDNSRHHLYAYRIVGSSNQWLPVGLDNKISLNGLPYGNYELVISAVDGFGNHQDEVFRMQLTILVPWYLTGWAKAVYFIIAALLIGGIVWFYNVKKKLHDEEQRRQKMMEQLEARSNFFSHLSSELKRLLAHVIAPTEQLMDCELTERATRLSEEARGSATQMNELIRQAFDLSYSRSADKRQPKVSADIVRFCHGFIKRFESSHKEYSNIHYGFQSETAELHKKIDVVKLDSILNILISFLSREVRQEGSIQIRIRQTTDQVLIAVKGTPVSIKSSQIPQLFNHYNQTLGDDNYNTNTELYLVREYLTEINGTIETDFDSEGKAITFLMEMPLESAKEEKTHTIAGNNKPTMAIEDRKYTEDDHTVFINKVTAIIEKHIMDSEFNVAMLQYELGMGEKMLYRKIKQYTGFSPVEYIRHIRINRAALLLKEGNFSVSEVMYMVGFTYSGYFSKCFQSVYGVNPAKYKKDNAPKQS